MRQEAIIVLRKNIYIQEPQGPQAFHHFFQRMQLVLATDRDIRWFFTSLMDEETNAGYQQV